MIYDYYKTEEFVNYAVISNPDFLKADLNLLVAALSFTNNIFVNPRSERQCSTKSQWNQQSRNISPSKDEP